MNKSAKSIGQYGYWILMSFWRYIIDATKPSFLYGQEKGTAPRDVAQLTFSDLFLSVRLLPQHQWMVLWVHFDLTIMLSELWKELGSLSSNHLKDLTIWSFWDLGMRLLSKLTSSSWQASGSLDLALNKYGL